jgi:hypothetical protein
MVAPKLADEEFIRLFTEHGPAEMARRTGQGQRRLLDRRRNLELKYKRQIASPVKSGSPQPAYQEHPGRISIDVPDGVVLVGSDWHIWPGPASLMHRAFVRFCKDLKPKVVIANGDIVDLGGISRHPPIGWTHMPTVDEEREAAQERLAEIEKAAFKARKIWPLGNHDARWETSLASRASEFKNVPGTSLSDFFPLWEKCWSVEINGNVMVTHRQAGGVHATYNNAMKSGRTMVTGHLHSAQVRPWTDYNGTRFGVDTGCMADTYGPQFEYMEDGYRNWVSGFGVLTFRNGVLLWPELVTKFDDKSVQFRGEVICP